MPRCVDQGPAVSPARVGTRDLRGYIIPVGGAEDKVSAVDILRKFTELCGGKTARIAIIPTASVLPETGKKYEDLFDSLGAKRAKALPYNERSDADHKEWMEWLERATGIFLTGGNQLRLSTILGGTEVARTIRRLNARGVHVAGTSAGAAILCEHMIAFGKEGSTPRAGAASLAPGFGLTNRVIIDQHFRQRDRLGRLLGSLAYNPFAIGVGLDEDTAAFIDPDDCIEIVGSGALTVVDVSQLKHSSMAEASETEPICMIGVQLHILTQGATYDMRSRTARPPPAKEE
jgi:cyanophycinase